MIEFQYISSRFYLIYKTRSLSGITFLSICMHIEAILVWEIFTSDHRKVSKSAPCRILVNVHKEFQNILGGVRSASPDFPGPRCPNLEI